MFRTVDSAAMTIAIVESDDLLINSASDALDLLGTAHYQTGCDALILPKYNLSEEFFRLSTGLAGDVLQKFVNYRMKVAIIGDFSTYHSEPLQAFMGESNRGNSVFFARDEAEAIALLTASR